MVKDLSILDDYPEYNEIPEELMAIIGSTIGSNIQENDIHNLVLKFQFGDVRIHGEQDPVTMDYRPDRVNVVTDENNKIIRINLG